jgi:hypothetical protein
MRADLADTHDTEIPIGLDIDDTGTVIRIEKPREADVARPKRCITL